MELQLFDLYPGKSDKEKNINLKEDRKRQQKNPRLITWLNDNSLSSSAEMPPLK